jgi:hypothetical protein
MGGIVFLIAAAAASQLSIGNVPLQPSDYLDGRAIAGATGAPVVMLTLSPRALARVKPLGPDAAVTLDGKPASARIADNTVEIDGQPDFDAAAALALSLSGKPPLPDSLDE